MRPVQLELFEDDIQIPQKPVDVGIKESIQYKCIDYEIPLDLSLDTYISIKRLSPPAVHLLGFQPAKTIPEIPRWFIQKYTSPNDTILDPFAGSGTSIIETLSLGRNSLWLDYHPLSRLICKAKTIRVPPFALLESVRDIISTSSNLVVAEDSVNFSNKDFWFQKSVQEGLYALRDSILFSDPIMQPALWLALASTVRKCSDMNDGMILAARRKNVQEPPERSRSDVFKYFRMYAKKTVQALAEWNQSAHWETNRVEELDTHDARILNGDWQCDAVVTSPPYINAIDYVWAAKFELHWLGLVESNAERLALYSKEIGTERISSAEFNTLGQTGHPLLDRLIEDIYTGKEYKASKGQNMLRSRVVYKYFLDMKQHFISCYHRLRHGGHYCFAVGDISKICGVDIPVASLLAELAEDIGYQEVFRFNLLLKHRKLNIPRNVDWASTIKHDTIVVLKKP